MIIYLDQNKWIQLAKVVYGKEKNEKILQLIELCQKGKVVVPLSSIHYMETARISNIGRRQRLGKVMWDISKGQTIISERAIVINELETELSKYYPQIQINKIKIIGKGIRNAFGMEHNLQLPPMLDELFERNLITWEVTTGIPIHSFYGAYHRKQFQKHLADIRQIKKDLPPSKWDDAIYAICLGDIGEPIGYVLSRNRIKANILQELGPQVIKEICDNMPTRRISVHLHKEVLRNDQYSPKETDLEDWAGNGIGAAYSDILVCEKHFRDLLQRNKFKTKAIILDNLEDVLEIMNP